MSGSNFGIRLAGVTFDNANLPITRDYEREIGQHPDVLGFWSPESDLVGLASSKVTLITDRSGLGRSLTQATDAQRPTYVAAGGPNDRPYVTYSPLTSLRYPTSLWPVDVSGGPYVKWSRFLLMRGIGVVVANQNRMIMGSMTAQTASDRHFLQFNGENKLQAAVGVAGAGFGSVNYTPDTWMLVGHCWDGALMRNSLFLNGALTAQVTAASGANALASSPTFGLGSVSSANGALFDGASAIVTRSDLSDQSIPANVTLLSAIRQFYRDRYKVTVA